VLQSDGSLLIPVMDEYNFTANAVCLIGYYRLIRQKLLTIQQINIENIDNQSYDFKLSIISSQLDSTLETVSSFSSYDIHVEGGSTVKAMYGYAVGLDHAILVQGSFSLISIEFWFTLDGNR